MATQYWYNSKDDYIKGKKPASKNKYPTTIKLTEKYFKLWDLAKAILDGKSVAMFNMEYKIEKGKFASYNDWSKPQYRDNLNTDYLVVKHDHKTLHYIMWVLNNHTMFDLYRAKVSGVE